VSRICTSFDYATALPIPAIAVNACYTVLSSLLCGFVGWGPCILPNVDVLQVTRRVSVPLQVQVKHHGIPPLTAKDKEASQKLLDEFSKREAEKRKTDQARNELESYIVNTRSKLDDDEIVEVRRQHHPAQCVELQRLTSSVP
jgi:hypothetical protein